MRYLVGPDPTYTAGNNPISCLVMREGDIVTKTVEHHDGDWSVIRKGDDAEGFIHPRHLTPVDETPTPPAVDDDLLYDLGSAMDDVYTSKRLMASHFAMASKLLASEAGQRLRAAWTAPVVREKERYRRESEERGMSLDVAERERDEARQLRSTLNQRLTEARNDRDDARRQAKGLRNQLGSTRALFDSDRADWERLRAALPVLPDVGPVTRDLDDTIQCDGYDFVDSDLPEDPSTLRQVAARTLAVAAFLDREAAERGAADTTTDDPRSDTVIDWAQSLINGDTTTVGPLDAGELLARLDAHRDRSTTDDEVEAAVADGLDSHDWTAEEYVRNRVDLAEAVEVAIRTALDAHRARSTGKA